MYSGLTVVSVADYDNNSSTPKPNKKQQSSNPLLGGTKQFMNTPSPRLLKPSTAGRTPTSSAGKSAKKNDAGLLDTHAHLMTLVIRQEIVMGLGDGIPVLQEFLEAGVVPIGALLTGGRVRLSVVLIERSQSERNKTWFF